MNWSRRWRADFQSRFVALIRPFLKNCCWKGLEEGAAWMVVSACQQVCISSHCDWGLESDEPLRLLAECIFFSSTPTQNQKTPWELSPRRCSRFSRFSCCSRVLHLCLWRKKKSAFRRKAESQEQCETKWLQPCWRNPDYRLQHSIMSWKKNVFAAANTQFSPVSFTQGWGRCHLPPTLQAWNTTVNQRESHQPLLTKVRRR